MYVKLFDSILDSSIWAEDMATRLVWITLLAMADRDGYVRVAPTALARRANVPRHDVLEALDILSSPDPESATPDNDGRRIEETEGGYTIVNYTKYRDLRDREQQRAQTRERVRRHRARKNATQQDTVTSNGEALPTALHEDNVTQSNLTKRHTDTDADTDTELQLLGADAPEKTFPDCMKAIRDHWTLDEASMKKQGSQLKALHKLGHGYDDIHDAIVGLALLHTEGKAGSPHMGLLYNKDSSQAVHLYQLAINRHHKEQDRRSPGRGLASLSDILPKRKGPHDDSR